MPNSSASRCGLGGSVETNVLIYGLNRAVGRDMFYLPCVVSSLAPDRRARRHERGFFLTRKILKIDGGARDKVTARRSERLKAEEVRYIGLSALSRISPAHNRCCLYRVRVLFRPKGPDLTLWRTYHTRVRTLKGRRSWTLRSNNGFCEYDIGYGYSLRVFSDQIHRIVGRRFSRLTRDKNRFAEYESTHRGKIYTFRQVLT